MALHPPPKNVIVYPNSSYSNLLNRISPMVCLITVNNFTIALEPGIPRNSHNFNGMGQILPDIGMNPLKFNGYRNIPPFFTGYRNGGGLQPPLITASQLHHHTSLKAPTHPISICLKSCMH